MLQSSIAVIVRALYLIGIYYVGIEIV